MGFKVLKLTQAEEAEVKTQSNLDDTLENPTDCELLKVEKIWKILELFESNGCHLGDLTTLANQLR